MDLSPTSMSSFIDTHGRLPEMYDFVIIWVHFNTILASLSFSVLFNIRRSPLPFSLDHSRLAQNVLRQWILFTRFTMDPFFPLPSCIENLWCENILKYEPFFSLFSFALCWYLFSCFQQFFVLFHLSPLLHRPSEVCFRQLNFSSTTTKFKGETKGEVFPLENAILRLLIRFLVFFFLLLGSRSL